MIEQEIANAYLSASIISSVLFFFGFIIFLAFLGGILTSRKSQQYRKLLTDMYVAGKIKILATKENIDLVKEEANFNLWCKKKRLEYQDLDKTIEEEMKEKIASVGEKPSKKDKE